MSEKVNLIDKVIQHVVVKENLGSSIGNVLFIYRVVDNMSNMELIEMLSEVLDGNQS